MHGEQPVMTVHAQLTGIATTFVYLPYIIVTKLKLSIVNLLDAIKYHYIWCKICATE